MEAWAEAAAVNFGASKQEALAAANQIAGMGKIAGLAGDDLVGFSQELVELGGDLASMYGGSTKDAIAAIGSGLRGEMEPLRRYNVLLDDATLRQRAFEMGIISTTTQALTPQQKVLAAQAEIMAQSTDAQGDYARTAGDMANTQRTLAGELANVNIEIGEKLLPVMLDLANFVRDIVVPAISLLSDWFIGPIVQGIANVITGVSDFIDTVAGIPGAVGDVIGAVGDFVTGNDDASDSMYQLEESAWETYQGVSAAAQEGMALARERTQEESEAIAQIPIDEIERRWEDTRRAAFQTVVEQAKGILDAQDQVKVAFEVLTQLQEEEQTRAQRIAYLQGMLTSAELASGLNDGRDGTRRAANALRAEIIAELAGLGVDAYQSGYNAGASIAAGLNASTGVVKDAAGNVAAAATGQLQIRSEPPDADSPLRGITQWGGNIAKTIADGMLGGVGYAGSAASALAGALVPGLGGVSPVSVGGAGGGGGNTYQVYVETLPEHPTLREIGGELRRLGEMGQLPGSGR